MYTIGTLTKTKSSFWKVISKAMVWFRCLSNFGEFPLHRITFYFDSNSSFHFYFYFCMVEVTKNVLLIKILFLRRKIGRSFKKLNIINQSQPFFKLNFYPFLHCSVVVCVWDLVYDQVWTSQNLIIVNWLKEASRKRWKIKMKT